MGFLDFFRGSKEERFARRFMQEIRRRGESRPLHFDAEQFAVRVGDDPAAPEQICYLQNAFIECERTDSGPRAEIIGRYAANANRSEVPEDYSQARARLRVVLKDRTYPESQALRNRAEFPDRKSRADNPLAYVPVAPDLIACLVDDDVSSIQFITHDLLARWGVSLERAFADARARMRETLAWAPTQVGSLFLSEAGDTYDAARLLFEDEIRRLPLRGRPVALVPDRETLLIAGSEDLEALEHMAQTALECLKERDRPVSGRPVVLGDDGWGPFSPPASIALPFDNLVRLFDAQYYAEQKETLDALNEHTGEDIFVASSRLREREESGRFVSWTTWSRGVVALLPEVDEVGFYDADSQEARMADWSAVRRVLGQRMQATEHCPARWRVDSFPSRDELMAMGARVV